MDAWDEVQYGLSKRITDLLTRVSMSDKESVQEIRLRLNAPVGLTQRNQTRYVKANGSLSERIESDCPLVRQQDLEETIRNYCDGSLYSKENELRQGYIRLRNGHRVGVAGLYSDENGNFAQATSINVRIAREIHRGWDPILHQLDALRSNILIVGPPGSGKTTLLREIAYRYSSQNLRVGIADERGEITGAGTFHLASSADAIVGLEKAKAIPMLLRFMNPQIILFDELADQIQELRDCYTAGVRIVTSLHADCLSGAHRRLKQLDIPAEVFPVFILLDGDAIGQVKEMARYEDRAADSGNSAHRVDSGLYRLSEKPRAPTPTKRTGPASSSAIADGERRSVLSNADSIPSGNDGGKPRLSISRFGR